MKFRKRPVVIEAWQTTVDGVIPASCQVRRMLSPTGARPPQWEVYDVLHETWVRFELGDWIIQGVRGECYPCKPDIFAETYEPVLAGDAAARPSRQEK